MFSANENLLLRQHKRRVVQWVEGTIPETALDAGTNVMVMQVACTAPGCVPLETAIIIVFPQSASELIPGLPQSQGGGNYKTKILKPMDQVTQDDVLEALPPEFQGGRKSLQRQLRQARDAMLAQIMQVMDADDIEGRRVMAEYLMASLREYMERDCEPPEWGEEYSELLSEASVEPEEGAKQKEDTGAVSGSVKATVPASLSGTENIVMKRPIDSSSSQTPPVWTTATAGSTVAATTSTSAPPLVSQRRRQAQQIHTTTMSASSSSSILHRLSEREHAPGIRRPACPCCDPDNPANAAALYQMMQL